ncbi:MAG: single-stranded-DNA-specific exonuclease RecJ [Alphaproteobacteria bacterium]|nr:single-stranded-DNA-specific exonuclease RecJ [Alphaproteobacteria bacterium]
MTAAENPVSNATSETDVLVAKSVTGRRWVQRVGDDRTGLALAQRLDLPEIVGRVMAARGIEIEAAEQFLEPTLRDVLPDPARLQGMDVAAERLADAIRDGDSIAIFGDYDVDGATSSALLARFLSAAGVPARVYIPDRITEGYGPTTPAMLRLRAEGVGLVITVDCGTTAFEPLEAAADAGLDVIVVDHHVAEPALPRAVSVINPNRFDDTSGQGALAAVGVSFLFAIAVNRVLRERGWYAASGKDEPDLLGLLDLVALGTVCDVVPLVGVNRAFVSQGLKVMARRQNPGLVALADVARVDTRPTEYHAGFLLGPRVNAGGRVGEAPMGARLLMTPDSAEAVEIAQRLDGWNTERREIEAQVQETAMAQAEDIDSSAALIIASGDGWHPGVIGIVAGRLKERFNRPAFVIGFEGDTGKGSGRSVEGVDLGSAVIAARQAGLLINGGGHKMAAGLTVERGKLAELQKFLDERVAHDITRNAVVPTLRIDGAVALSGVQPDFVEFLQRLAPFGVGNAEPRFVLPAVRVAKADVVGTGHVRCFLTGPDGGRLKAIAFRAAGEPLGNTLLNTDGLALQLAGKLRPDNWQGRNDVQLIIDDAAVSAAVA